MSQSLLPEERALVEKLMEEFKLLRTKVAAEAFELFDERGKLHDKDQPFWHRYPWGDKSYAQMCLETAGRVVGMLSEEVPGVLLISNAKLDDRILDMINWSIMWLTWRRMRAAQSPLPTFDPGVVLDAPATGVSAEPTEEVAVATPPPADTDLLAKQGQIKFGGLLRRK